MFKPTSPLINFSELEERILSWWYSSNLINKYLSKNSQSKNNFSFIDGPITANNPMGVHHGWSRTYKDLWQRFNNMRGKKQRFQNGFDCQGLWVEVEVEKELGFKTKKDIEKYGVYKFVEKCKERVLKYAAIQTDQSKRLGYFMDWDHSYFTMSNENNYMIWHFLKVCFKKGWIYKGLESVPWCPRCETAISQHEMLTEDYKEVIHESIYFKLPLVGKKREYLLVWTTTPWTLPANIAVAVDKKLSYSLVEETGGDLLWIATNLVSRVFKNKHKRIVKTVLGDKLVGLEYKSPFDHLEVVSKVAQDNPGHFHIVIATEEKIMPITTNEGTGLVHTAVSAGTEDYKLGKKLNLPMIPVIADNADYLPNLGEFSGKNAKKDPRIILDYLIKQKKTVGRDWVFLIEKYKHRYPACWRCKTELVWKVTDEWYIAMDKKDPENDHATFREKMIKITKEINWLPSFGLERELDWLNNMNDWLISKKNRYWGLALPIYECRNCSSFEVIGGREELKKRAISGWDEFAGHTPHKPWIDEVKIKCSKCGKILSRIKDVGNPWLDAGIVPFSTITRNNQGSPLYFTDKTNWSSWYPAEFITESFPGQFKNWFYALIAMAAALENSPPFKTVLGFATLLSEDGRPMHKSWGNMIEFNDGAEKIGVDVMRWMYIRQNPSNNLLFGYKVADEIRRKFHLILWNTYNFFITYANLHKFNPQKYGKRSTQILDRWIISKLHSLILETTNYLEIYDAYKSAVKIEEFVSDLSTWYVRRSRSRVNQNASKQQINNCLTTLYEVLISLTKLLAPMTPFITEEMYKNLTNKESVHLADWPGYNKKLINLKLEKEMGHLRGYVESFHSLRKEKDIKLRIPVKNALYLRKQRFTRELEDVLTAELNIKNLSHKIISKPSKYLWKVDFSVANLLLEEGEAREIVRKIQQLRKKENLGLSEKIIIYLPSYPKEYKKFIQDKTLAIKIISSDTLKISRLS